MKYDEIEFYLFELFKTGFYTRLAAWAYHMKEIQLLTTIILITH